MNAFVIKEKVSEGQGMDYPGALSIRNSRFTIFMLTVRMERSGVAILLLQHGWQITPSTVLRIDKAPG